VGLSAPNSRISPPAPPEPAKVSVPSFPVSSFPMKPWERLGEARTPDGKPMTLTRRDTEYLILLGSETLMTNRAHESEDALAQLACEPLRRASKPCVLVGGLGMGFTLRAALDLLPADATVVVAELLPAVIEWNRGVLAPLAGHPLADPRVQVVVADVSVVMRSSQARFDAVLLDVDNGPEAFASSVNGGLYGDTGLFAARTALKFGGTLAIWSAWTDKHFPSRLRYAGFTVRTEHVRSRIKRGGHRHTVYLAQNGSALPVQSSNSEL
jgi:spermidine synthase